MRTPMLVLRRAPRLGAVLLALLLIGSVAEGQHRDLIPGNGILPWYVRMLGDSGPDGYVAMAFYYPPELVPGDYLLWDQPVFAPPVGVVPPYVEGFTVWGNDPAAIAPILVEFHSAPGAKVPIWFCPMTPPDDFWTVNHVLAAWSPLFGLADIYHETLTPLDPLDPTSPSHINVEARGVLADGRTFYVHALGRSGGFSKTIIRFGD